jgi:hypothetical protein
VGVEMLGLVNNTGPSSIVLAQPIAASIMAISCGVGFSTIMLLITSLLGSACRYVQLALLLTVFYFFIPYFFFLFFSFFLFLIVR